MTSLLTETPGSELHATWEVLSAAGANRAGLKNIRTSPAVAAAVVKAMSVHQRRAGHVYPPEYKPLGIVEQVKVLQKVPAFAELDAAWALNEAPAWYDDLDLPDWIENPLVYVWHESLGGYHNALDLILKAIAKERKFYNYRDGQLTPERLRQSEATREAELKLKADQPGDFLIVPSQVGDRWGNYPVKEVRESYDEGEFGHGSVAGGCLILSHPNRIVRFDELDMDFPGDEFDDPDADDPFGRAPDFLFYDGGVKFGARHVGNAHGHFGSVSGFFPQ
ncbi:hypothetical protein KC727_00940 [Candidatus Kaiserbacteria bacterium]|nr:hypothetical protein [Candidatus Kaiserbacteria bacterium]